MPALTGRYTHVRAALVVVAVAFVPGQASASALRWWLVCGLLPLGWVWMTRDDNPWADPFARLWGLVGLWAAASALWTPNPGAALMVGFLWLSLGVGLSAGRYLSRERRAVEGLSQGAILCGVGGAVPALTPWFSYAGTFGNPNHLAALLSLTLLWTLLPAIETPKRVLPRFLKELLAKNQPDKAPQEDVPDAPRPLFVALRGGAAVVQLVALYQLNSLGAWAALGVGLVFALIWAISHRWGWVAAGITTAACTVAAYPVLQLATVQEHLRSRLYMARIGWEIAVQHPLKGVGAGQMPAAWMEAQAAWFADPAHDYQFGLWSQLHHVHNEALQAAGELGWVAALVLAVPVLAVFVRRPHATAAWATLPAMGVLGVVTLPLYEPTTALLFALGLGVVLGPAPEREPAGPKRFALSLVLAAGATLVMGAHVVSDRLLASGVEDRSPGTLELSATLSLQPATSLRYAAEAIADSDPLKALAYAKEAAEREPSPRAWAFVGQIAVQAADLTEARDAYTRAVALHPWYFTGHFNLAIVARDLGDIPLSRRHAERARSLRPNDPLIPSLP